MYIPGYIYAYVICIINFSLSFGHAVGEEKVGCYLVPSSSDTLSLLEDTTAYLSDDPTTRTQPVAKCGLSAMEQGFNIFGVSVGYCISGSNNPDDYKDFYYPGYCSDGNGGVFYVGSFPYFFMDVYKIVDVSDFTTSADEAVLADASPSASPSPSPTADAFPGAADSEPSGAGAQSYSSLLLLFVPLVTVLSTLLL